MLIVEGRRPEGRRQGGSPDPTKSPVAIHNPRHLWWTAGAELVRIYGCCAVLTTRESVENFLKLVCVISVLMRIPFTNMMRAEPDNHRCFGSQTSPLTRVCSTPKCSPL